jgi:ADP-heptose:LPS heptosyltransferase
MGRPPPAVPRRILVLGYAAIGDLIFFLPVLEALRREWPQAQIVFLSNYYATTEELLPATGLVDEIWFEDWEKPDAALRRAAINRRIHEGCFDLAVLSLSAPAHHFQWGLRGIPLRVGHCRRFSAFCGPGWRGPWRAFRKALITGEFSRRAILNRIVWIGSEAEHALRRNLRVLLALGLPQSPWPPRPKLPVGPRERSIALEKLGGKSGRMLIGVHLGVLNNPYGKMWDAERFGELCQRILEEIPAEIILIGGSGEKESAGKALRICPRLRSLVGILSLLESFAVVEACDLFMSNDTGLAKAAMCLGVPTATWWGPSDPVEYGAVWEAEKHLDIRTKIWCSPCSRMGMPKEGVLNYISCGHHDCLKKLETGFALEALRRKYWPLPGARGEQLGTRLRM